MTPIATGWRTYINGNTRFVYRALVDPITWQATLQVKGAKNGKPHQVVTQLEPRALSHDNSLLVAAIQLWNPPQVVTPPTDRLFIEGEDQLD